MVKSDKRAIISIVILHIKKRFGLCISNGFFHNIKNIEHVNPLISYYFLFNIIFIQLLDFYYILSLLQKSTQFEFSFLCV